MYVCQSEANHAYYSSNIQFCVSKTWSAYFPLIFFLKHFKSWQIEKQVSRCNLLLLLHYLDLLLISNWFEFASYNGQILHNNTINSCHWIIWIVVMVIKLCDSICIVILLPHFIFIWSFISSYQVCKFPFQPTSEYRDHVWCHFLTWIEIKFWSIIWCVNV